MALSKQVELFAMKFTSGETDNLFVPLTRDMVAEQARLRRENRERMRMEVERNAERMATSENEDVAVSPENQVGGNVCANACGLQ